VREDGRKWMSEVGDGRGDARGGRRKKAKERGKERKGKE